MAPGGCVSDLLLTAAERRAERVLLLLLRLDPDVEVDALAVDDDLPLADFGPQDDPVVEYHVPHERNLEGEPNSYRSVREVESRVVATCNQESPRIEVRRA